MVLLNRNIQNLPDYPFDKLRALLDNTIINTKVTDMSIGQPMHSVPGFIKETIYKAQDKWNNYPPLAGIPALQTAYLKWLESRFNVSSFFDEQNILPLSGTKEGLFSVSMTLNIQKICLPNPFYQVYLAASLLDNVKKYFLICNADNNFLIDLKTT